MALAAEERAEARVWELWLAQLPNMTQKTFVPYETYRDGALGRSQAAPAVSQEPAEEIFARARRISAAIAAKKESQST